jgi:hypothetical protein
LNSKAEKITRTHMWPKSEGASPNFTCTSRKDLVASVKRQLHLCA